MRRCLRYIHDNSLGASIERYNNKAWHEDSFNIKNYTKKIFKKCICSWTMERKEIFPLLHLGGKMVRLISIAKAQVHLD